MLGRALNVVVAMFGCALFIMVFHFIAKGDLEKPSAPVIEYKDFVTILLTSLAVMIAVATVIAALIAIWGFDFIQRATKTSAENVAREHAEKIAQARVEAMLPALVQDAVRFETQNLSGSANRIAEEVAKDSDV